MGSDPSHPLPIGRQAQRLDVSSSSIYYQLQPTSDPDLALMRTMGIEAQYQKPRASGRDRKHPVLPYLPRGMSIEPPNQVWAMDTTYIPMSPGFVYLATVVDGPRVEGRRSGCRSAWPPTRRFLSIDMPASTERV